MTARKQRRRNGIIDRLDDKRRAKVDEMICNGATYRKIVEYLKGEGIQLSKMAICTYAKRYLESAQMLRIAQDNFKMMMDEIDRHPDLDTTEGIVRVMSNSIFNALTQVSPEDWQKVEPDKLIREANALVRVASQKKRAEMQNKTKENAAIDAIQGEFKRFLEKDYPDLYRQFAQACTEIQAKQGI